MVNLITSLLQAFSFVLILEYWQSQSFHGQQLALFMDHITQYLSMHLDLLQGYYYP